MHNLVTHRRTTWFRTLLLIVASSLAAQAQTAPRLAPDTQKEIDKIAQEVLAKTGVPSASIAVVEYGQIAYVQAYGKAKLEPEAAARPEMRYAIGSISKQFTATAILMLAEQGKLSLDDPVSRFVPTLTRANEVKIRQLLSHTAGYQDYWPQDYVMPMMLKPTSAEAIMDMWARKPLDYEPGTKWEYSNTGFVIAGVIAEKASGMPLFRFLSERVFVPLGMKSVADVDQQRLADSDPTPYMRYGLGPLHPAPKEGKGWLFAAADLAMTASDLARWDVAMIEQRLLKPASYHEMQTDVNLTNGQGTGYGLGIDVGGSIAHRMLSHGGEVSGFTAQNNVYPDDRAAVVVLTNQDAVGASSDIAQKIGKLLIGGTADAKQTALARKVFEELQQGKIERALFTDDANFHFSDQALQDFASSLGPLGTPQEFTETSQGKRGGMGFHRYRVKFEKKTVSVVSREMPDGKFEQYQVFGVE